MSTSGGAVRRFKTWFWRPPRLHGETILDRRVSPLELLYDLIYAAVIAQAGHRLTGQVSAAGVIEFAAVFSLTWFAWTNGSLYLELQGSEPARGRRARRQCEETKPAKSGARALARTASRVCTGSPWEK